MNGEKVQYQHGIYLRYIKERDIHVKENQKKD